MTVTSRDARRHARPPRAPRAGADRGGDGRRAAAWRSTSQAGAARPEEPASPSRAAPRDDEALLEEFKTMFRAVEEGGEPDRGG